MQTRVPIIGENLVASIMRHNLSSLTLDFMKFASIYFFCVLMILELLLFWFFSLKETEWRAFESWGEGGGIWFVLQSSNTGYWRRVKILRISECLKLFWPSFKKLFCYVSAHSIWWCCENELYHFGNKISERKRWRVEGLLNIKFDYECLACSSSLFCL